MSDEDGMTLIVKTVSRLLFPIMFLFGIYIIVHGHLTPGGGFPGGVVIATSVAMVLLGYGMHKAEGTVGEFYTEISESLGALIIVVLGILGIFFVGNFLEAIVPLGTLGKLFSGGNLFVLNLGVGIKVAAGLVSILYAMLAFKGGGKK